jgi:hypothetical protein
MSTRTRSRGTILQRAQAFPQRISVPLPPIRRPGAMMSVMVAKAESVAHSTVEAVMER